MENTQSIYGKVKDFLTIASQFIITAPLKLPPKVVVVARYVVLALGVLEAAEKGAGKGIGKQEGEGDENG